MLFCFERIHVVYLRYACLHKRKGIKPLLRLYAFMCMLWFDFVFSKIKRKFVSESGFVPQIAFIVYQKLKVKSRCNFNFFADRNALRFVFAANVFFRGGNGVVACKAARADAEAVHHFRQTL